MGVELLMGVLGMDVILIGFGVLRVGFVLLVLCLSFFFFMVGGVFFLGLDLVIGGVGVCVVVGGVVVVRLGMEGLVGDEFGLNVGVVLERLDGVGVWVLDLGMLGVGGLIVKVIGG